MDKTLHSSDTPAIRLVEKPKSGWSGLLNGAGNGAMVGGIGLVAYSIKDHISMGRANDKLFLLAAGAAGIATAIGAVYGLKEAKQVNDYRNALATDIETLHAQIDSLDPRVAR